MKGMKHKIIGIIVLGMMVLSCMKEQEAGGILPYYTTSYSEVAISASQLPLYADLSAYNRIPDSRTRANDMMLSLESLLNRDETIELQFNGTVFRQTPFLQNKDDVFASISDNLDETGEFAVIIKKYLVETFEPEADSVIAQVTTVIAEKSYADTHPDYDFLDRPDFSGFILYSTITGALIGARHYHNGQIAAAQIYPTSDVRGDEGGLTMTQYAQASQTRSDDLEWLTASICIDYGYNWLFPSYCIDDYIRQNGSNNNQNPSGTGGGAGNRDQSKDEDPDPTIQPKEPEYTVELYSNMPDLVTLTINEELLSLDYSQTALLDPSKGVFSRNASLVVSPRYDTSVSQVKFGYWTGTFENRDTDYFRFKIESDVVSTAYYETKPPCKDKTKGVTNPLHNMNIAATKSGSYLNGTFGVLRNAADNRYHRGIDLAADIGTPVYSMYDGTIVHIDDYYTDSYVRGSFGNIIVIKHTIPGQNATLYFQYSHLNAGTPVAVNPRTRVPYAVGDKVYSGDLIGYTGRTGNAGDIKEVPNAHLDLMVGKTLNQYGRLGIPVTKMDPTPFLNGTVDLENIQSDKGKIKNIKCD